MPHHHPLATAVLLLATTALLATSAPAQSTPASAEPPPPNPTYGPWLSSRIGGGGYVQRLAISSKNPNRIYTYVDMAGAYRSDDGGKSWRMIHAALPPTNGGYDIRGVSLDPRDDNHVLYCVGNHRDHAYGIFESTDAGATYTLIHKAVFSGNGGPNRAAGQVIDRSPFNPDTLIAGEYDGLSLSTDNGKTWRTLPSSDPGSSSNPDPMRSRDPKGSESSTDTPDSLFAHYQLTDIRFDIAVPNRIYICTQPYKGVLQGKQVDFHEAFFRSDDNGKTFTKLADTSPSEIIQSPADPTRLFGIFDARELRQSTDAGATWTPCSQGLPTTTKDLGSYTSPYRYRALTAGPTFILAGNSAGHIFKLDLPSSTPPTWTEIPRTIHNNTWWSRKAAPDGDFGHAMGNLSIDPANPNHWLMTDWYAVWHSYDAGANWSLGISGYEPTYVFHLLPAPPTPGEPNTLHITVADNGYLRSTDGGRSFSRDCKGISSQIRDIDLSPANPRRLYAVGASPKTGGNWVVNQLYLSSDAGSSWSQSPMTGLPNFGPSRFCASVTVDPQNENTLYLAVSGTVAPGDGGPYKSTDAGQSWTWIGQGLPPASLNNKSFFRATFWGRGRELQTLPNGGLLAGPESSKTLYAYNPTENRWGPAHTFPGTLSSIAPDPTTPARLLVSSENDGLYLSTDNAQTFTKVYSGHPGEAAWNPQTPGQAIASSSDTFSGTPAALLFTNDAGTTWTPLDQSLPMRGSLRPAFLNNHPAVGTSGSGVFLFTAPLPH